MLGLIMQQVIVKPTQKGKTTSSFPKLLTLNSRLLLIPNFGPQLFLLSTRIYCHFQPFSLVKIKYFLFTCRKLSVTVFLGFNLFNLQFSLSSIYNNYLYSKLIIILKMSVQIKVVTADLTRDTESFGKMDPYCLLKLGQHTFKSKTKDNAGKKPVWNQTFTFNTTDNLLKISVMDQDTVKDDVIGQATVDITRFRNNPNEQQELVQLFYKGKTAGRLQLVIRGVGGINPNNFGQGNLNIQPGFNPLNQQPYQGGNHPFY